MYLGLNLILTSTRFNEMNVSGAQGALDGGLDIPHGDKRFVGYDTEAKKLDPEQLKRYILGGHVSSLLHCTSPAKSSKTKMFWLPHCQFLYLILLQTHPDQELVCCHSVSPCLQFCCHGVSPFFRAARFMYSHLSFSALPALQH